MTTGIGEERAAGARGIAVLDGPQGGKPATIEEARPAWQERLGPQARQIIALLTRDAVRVPLTIFTLSRLYIFLLGAIAVQINQILPPVAALGYYMPDLTGWQHYLIQPWRNWDGHWFALIAQEGYFEKSTTAFFPLYPLLLRGGSWLLDGQIALAGVLIANVALLGALFLLYQLIQLDFPRAVARRALLYLALFPTAYYLGAVYSESLVLFL